MSGPTLGKDHSSVHIVINDSKTFQILNTMKFSTQEKNLTPVPFVKKDLQGLIMLKFTNHECTNDNINTASAKK